MKGAKGLALFLIVLAVFSVVGCNIAINCAAWQRNLQPGKWEAWMDMGDLCFRHREWGLAAESYLRAGRISYKDLGENLNLLVADEAAAAEALDFFAAMVKESPNPFNHLITGDLKRLRGDLEGAARNYRQGIIRNTRCDRGGLRCATELAKICLAKGDLEGARWALEPALLSWPDDLANIELAVELYSALGELSRLKRWARKLVGRLSSSVAGHRALARCHFAAGEAERARKHTDLARELCEKRKIGK